MAGGFSGRIPTMTDRRMEAPTSVRQRRHRIVGAFAFIVVMTACGSDSASDTTDTAPDAAVLPTSDTSETATTPSTMVTGAIDDTAPTASIADQVASPEPNGTSPASPAPTTTPPVSATTQPTTTPPVPATTQPPASTAAPAPPPPTAPPATALAISAEDIASLERELDEIDALLRDLEAGFAAD